MLGFLLMPRCTAVGAHEPMQSHPLIVIVLLCHCVLLGVLSAPLLRSCIFPLAYYRFCGTCVAGVFALSGLAAAVSQCAFPTRLPEKLLVTQQLHHNC